MSDLTTIALVGACSAAVGATITAVANYFVEKQKGNAALATKALEAAPAVAVADVTGKYSVEVAEVASVRDILPMVMARLERVEAEAKTEREQCAELRDRVAVLENTINDMELAFSAYKRKHPSDP